MEQLNFFDYLGLEQFKDDESFLYNLPGYSFRSYLSENYSGIVIEYKALSETKTRVIPRQAFVINPNLYKYLAKTFE